MTSLPQIAFHELNLDSIAEMDGRVAVLIDEGGAFDKGAGRVNREKAADAADGSSLVSC